MPLESKRRTSNMRKLTVTVLLILVIALPAIAADTEYRRLPVAEYEAKMKAGWIGQMVGVGWGAPTEFKWRSAIIPKDEVPEWKPRMVNQFGQDDLYVEMTFLRTLELYGIDASIRQAGIDFANSRYDLWHANRRGRINLRNGIAPPDSGHPKFSSHADDIDYQIEADYAGLISPGLPNSGIKLGEIFGRLMNYGDGLYGGQFVAGMYAEAFFEKDMEKVVRAGLACVPKGSQFHECISDVLKWYEADPDNWQATWQLIEDKYQNNPAYRQGSCPGDGPPEFNIDAKINAAYIVMGLLYGKRDPDRTMTISMRCGQDSDCNPSNAAGVLFTSIGLSALPEHFVAALDEEGKFSHTPYDYPKLVQVCSQLTRQIVLKQGGRIEKDEDDQEVLVIPVRRPNPSALEQSWEPGPIASSRFTEEETSQIRIHQAAEADPAKMEEAMKIFAPGWDIYNCGDEMEPGLHEELAGKKNVLVTYPLSEDGACAFYQPIDIPEGKTTLHLVVGHHKEGDWNLVVINGDSRLFETVVGSENAEDGWMEVAIDLSKFAGSKAHLELMNEANGWEYEVAYWAKIEIVTE
jgi:hypothetical protein